MSYDVWLEIDAGNGPVMIGRLDANYTYNLAEFIHWGLEQGLRDFDGKEAREFLNPYRNLLHKIHGADQKELREKHDAPNGWGTALGCLAFLSDIALACAEAPDAIMRVG